MKWIRKVVDERQEQEMLRVERSSFWFLFFALAVAITVQIVGLQSDFRQVAGEYIVLAAGGIWSLVGYIRHGTWDYFSKPGYKSYLVYSTMGALIFGLVLPVSRYFRDGVPLLSCLILFVTNFIFIFAILFVTLLFLGCITNRQQKKLQQEYEDEV